jgi:hypothetical protein
MAEKHKLKENRIISAAGKILPECLVVLACVLVLMFFVSRKEGYHMDELLSFELSNAEFTPWIVPTQPVGRLEKFVVNEIRGDSVIETLKNVAAVVEDVLSNGSDSLLLSYKADVYDEPVWLDRQQFADYITVGENDGFNYLSVYFNVKDDNHPPLHFMLLHTVSSFFKGSFSAAMGCSINIAAIVGILILLIKLGRIYADKFDICDRRILGMTAALVYGLSAGAVATVLLIRMYALLTFFCVALFYIHIKKLQDNNFRKNNGLMILVTVLGFLTQYFFLLYCIPLALITAVILLKNKNFKALFSYVRSMITAACIGLLCFPFAISDVFSSTRGVEALENLKGGISGYGERLADFWDILVLRTGGVRMTAVFVIAVILLAAAVIYGHISEQRRLDKNKLQLVFFLVLPETVYFLLASRLAPYRVDRYIMPLFPFMTFTIVLAILAACGGRRIQTRTVTCLLIISSVAGIFTYDGEYLYTGYSKQLEIAEEYEDTPCICVYAGVGYYENLAEFTKYEKTLLVTTEELADREDKESISENESVIVIVKYGAALEDTENIMEEQYGFTKEEVLYSTRDITADIIIRFFKTDTGSEAGTNL